MNPRLVEPGSVVACYTATAPLVRLRTSTATATRSESEDIGRETIPGLTRVAQVTATGMLAVAGRWPPQAVRKSAHIGCSHHSVRVEWGKSFAPTTHGSGVTSR